MIFGPSFTAEQDPRKCIEIIYTIWEIFLVVLKLPDQIMWFVREEDRRILTYEIKSFTLSS